MCEVSIPNSEISPRKYAMKKCIFSASIYIGKSHSLIHSFNNYRRNKCQTIVQKQKVLSFFFWWKVIVKNNDFATQKWRICRPGRMAWERLIESYSYIWNTYKLRNSLKAFRLVSVSSFSKALLPSAFVAVFLRFLLAVRDESKNKFIVSVLQSVDTY